MFHEKAVQFAKDLYNVPTGTPLDDLKDVNRHYGGMKKIPTEPPPPAAKFQLEREPFPTLLYPINMTPEDFFPESICFSVRQRKGLSLEQVVDSLKEGAHVIMNPGENYKKLKAFDKDALAAGVVLSDEKALQEYEASINQARPPDDLGENTIDGFVTSGSSMGKKMSKQSELRADGTTINTLGNIYMNMPNNVQYSEAANWEATPLGFIGAMKNMSLGESGGGAALGQAGNLAAAGLGGTLGFIAKKLGVSSSNAIIGAALGGLSQGSKLQSGLESVMSMTQNPYMEMLFQGVGFRQFTFNFIMRPRNEDEVGAVNAIIKMFRMHSRPSWAMGTLGQSFMRYPMEFHISFLTLDSGTQPVAELHGKLTKADEVYNINTNLPQLKPCVCTGVETNYTPQSIWATYKSGQPIAVNLGLSFKETQLVMAEDVGNSF